MVDADDDAGWAAYSYTGADHELLQKALTDALQSAGPDYGEAVKRLRETVARADPLKLMGVATMYFGSVEVGTNPEYNRREGVFGHHLELLQAFCLLPPESAPDPHGSPLGAVVLDAVDAVKGLANAFVALELAKIARASGPARRRAEALLRLKVNSFAVRGWAYETHLRPMLSALFAPLDEPTARSLGWRPTAVIDLWWAMTRRVDERLAAHRELVQAVLQWPLDDIWLDRVRDTFGVLPGPPDQVLQALFAADDEARQGFVMHSSDLSAHEIYRFTASELISLADGTVDEEPLRDLLAVWSLPLGQALGVSLNVLLLENPVIERPFVSGHLDEWHIYCGWLLPHNVFPLLEAGLRRDTATYETYLGRRADFLEERASELLKNALPGAHVERGLRRTDSAGMRYENDVLALVDSYAVIVEAKSGRLGPDARRGKQRPLRDRIGELVDKPAEQAERLASHLLSNPTHHTFSREDGTKVAIDGTAVRRAVSVGLTLDPVAAALPGLSDLSESGLSSRAVDALIYSLSVIDLELVVEMLDHPSEILHYLGRRTEVERSSFLSGDETDLLGFYLVSGFNLGSAEFGEVETLRVTGLSDPVDTYHYRREAGLDAVKPQVRRTPGWEAVLTRVEERANPRWTEIGVAMCNVAHEQQRELEAAMQELREGIAAGTRPNTDMLVFQNGPAERRDVFVGVIAHGATPEERAERCERAAKAAIGTYDLPRVILLSWALKPTSEPYAALGFYEV